MKGFLGVLKKTKKKTFGHLPEEMIVEVLSFVEYDQLRGFRNLSKQYRKLLDEKAFFWKVVATTQYFRKFGKQEPEETVKRFFGILKKEFGLNTKEEENSPKSNGKWKELLKYITKRKFLFEFKQISEWNFEDVEKWFNFIGMEKFYIKFKEEKKELMKKYVSPPSRDITILKFNELELMDFISCLISKLNTEVMMILADEGIKYSEFENKQLLKCLSVYLHYLDNCFVKNERFNYNFPRLFEKFRKYEAQFTDEGMFTRFPLDHYRKVLVELSSVERTHAFVQLIEKKRIEEITLHIMIYEFQLNSAKKGVRKVFSKFMKMFPKRKNIFGFCHTSIVVGDKKNGGVLELAWNDSHLCLPRTSRGGNLSMFGLEIDKKYFQKISKEEIISKISKVIYEYNTKYKYRVIPGGPLEANSERLVRRILKELRIDIDDVNRDYKKLISKFQIGVYERQLIPSKEFVKFFELKTKNRIVFKTHLSLDEFVINILKKKKITLLELKEKFKEEYDILNCIDYGFWYRIKKFVFRLAQNDAMYFDQYGFGDEDRKYLKPATKINGNFTEILCPFKTFQLPSIEIEEEEEPPPLAPPGDVNQ